MAFGPGGKPCNKSTKRIRIDKARRPARNPNARSPLQLEQDLAEESEMFKQGYSLYSIAKKFGVSQMQISRDLKKCRIMWHERTIQNIQELKAEEIAKLDQLEHEAHLAWERSQEDAEKVETTKRVAEALQGKNPLRHKVGTGKLAQPFTKKVETENVTREGQYGDPRFLGIRVDCIKLRSEILGLKTQLPQETPDAFKTQQDTRDLLLARIKQLQPAAPAPEPEPEEKPAETKPEAVN